MQEAERQGELVELVREDRAADLEHRKLVGRREDAQIALDFAFSSNGIE